MGAFDGTYAAGGTRQAAQARTIRGRRHKAGGADDTRQAAKRNNFPAPPHTLGMGLIVLRTAIIFLALFAVMRLMGKRQIGEMQPFELVITLLIAELACIPMADTSIPLLYGAASVLTIFFLHQLMLIADLKCKGLKKVIGGKPAVVINKNGVDITQMKKNNLDITDLIESLRGTGCFSLADVDYALYEANGNFSTMPKEKEAKTGGASLPLVIIEEGKYNRTNLEKSHIPAAFFDGLLARQKIGKRKRVFILTADGAGNIYLQCYGEKYRTFRTQLPEGAGW